MSPLARWLAGLAASALLATGVLAAQPLPDHEAAIWLQKMAESARRLSYEGVFVFNQGSMMQTMHIVNRSGPLRERLLISLDGSRREVVCRQGESLSLVCDGDGVRTERLSRRYFPDLLPVDVAALTNWYTVGLGKMDRVAGLDCRWLKLTPKDVYRRGYSVCADDTAHLPLKAVMVNESGKPLLQYAFTNVRINANPPASSQPQDVPQTEPVAHDASTKAVTIQRLPPGYTRVMAVKRKLPSRPHEVEHWVYSDGLNHISLFIEPATRPVETVRGESADGLLSLIIRQVGNWQVTVVGDAPWPAVKTIAASLAVR